MKNNQDFVFERNRYYSGKMLTSADFWAEQQYMNQKRWFLNRTMFGKGIVWGCCVYNIDDLSLMVESGVLLDALGREMVIPQADIRKLSAIEGFEALESKRACLCALYEEETVNPVYAVSRTSEQTEYNRLREGYRLFLVDEEKMPPDFDLESEFFTEGILYQDGDYTLRMVMPAAVCLGMYTRIDFELRKDTDNAVAIEYEGTFQMTSFEDRAGRQEYRLAVDGKGMEAGDVRRRELWVKVCRSEDETVKIILKPGTAVCRINGERVLAKENLILDITMEAASPRELVDSFLGKTSLEMRTMSAEEEAVCLARIDVERTEQGYMITGIEENGVRNYIEAPADGALRSRFLNYFSLPGQESETVKEKAETLRTALRSEPEVTLSQGVFEIPLGEGARKGEIFYSGDIVYGAAGETVHISLGFDLEEETAVGAERITVLGSNGIFKSSRNAGEFPAVKTAVKIYRDKGVFQAGVRFLKDYDGVLLKCRWTALRSREAQGEDAGRKEAKKGCIAMEKSTLVLKPGESICLQVNYMDMPPCSVTYEVEGAGGGEITENGVYTAPEGEGVYEIHVYCTDMPSLGTYCYAVVRR